MLATRSTMTEAFARALEGCQEVVIEACYGWEWLGDLLEEMGFEVHLAHPYKVKLIAEAKVKTDKVDAHILAQLLRMRFLPEAYSMPKELREIRTLIRQRMQLVKTRTAIKNRIHALLARRGIRIPASDIFGVRGRKIIRGLQLGGHYQEVLERYMKLLEQIEPEIEKIETWMTENLFVDEKVRLLMTIPGVGLISAHVILYEIGEIERFMRDKKLLSYAGLVPQVRQSGDKCYYGRLIKEANKYLKWIMLEIAVPGGISYSPWRRLYNRVKDRYGANTAKVVVAREMLKAVYWVLKKREPFRRKKERVSRRKKLSVAR